MPDPNTVNASQVLSNEASLELLQRFTFTKLLNEGQQNDRLVHPQFVQMPQGD